MPNQASVQVPEAERIIGARRLEHLPISGETSAAPTQDQPPVAAQHRPDRRGAG